MARYLAGLPASTTRTLRLALFAFEWLPFPWRFSRLDVAAREDFLARMDRARWRLYRDLLLFMKVLVGLGYGADARVRAAVGYEARCGLRRGESEPAPQPLGELEPQGDGEECDVVVIGSGAGGASAAATLAQAGLDVLVIEAGAHYDRTTYPDNPLEALPALYRDGGLTIAEGKPAIPLPLGRAVGGTTVINSGTCFRTPRPVLESWRDEFGVDWATDLRSEFAAAERVLHVKRLDPNRMGRNGQLCMEGAKALGARGGPIARNAGGCVQCSSCPQGCRLDAKRAMHVSYLPRAVRAGARVRANVEAERILVRDGRAVGLACRITSPPGSGNGRPGAARRWEVRARHAVVAAGGAIGTPELLLRSGLASDQVGRNLRIHPACWVGALYDEDVRGWDGVMQSYYVDEWEEQGILLEATFTPLAFGAQWLAGVGRDHQRRVLDYGRVGSIGVHLKDTSKGRVGLADDGSARITYKLNDEDARTLGFGIARAAEIHFAAGAREVYPQLGRVPVIPRSGLAEFEATSFSPHELRLEAFHPMGTARMAADPARGATDVTGAVHGTERLYVTDASLFPNSTAVNPMITIIACSTRIAAGIAERFG